MWGTWMLCLGICSWIVVFTLSKYLSPLDAVKALAELTALERGAAHLLCGSVPRIRSFSDKKIAARYAYVHMKRANRLRQHANILTRPTRTLLKINSGITNLISTLDSLHDKHSSRLKIVNSFLLPKIKARYRKLKACCDPLSCEYIIQICSIAEQEFIDLPCHRNNEYSLSKKDRAKANEAWRLAFENPESILLDEASFKPIDRVPKALRENQYTLGTPGEVRPLPSDINQTKQVLITNLHKDLDGEYSAMELFARNSYEHSYMPWEFHLEILRQTADEARHADILSSLIKQYGGEYGDLPIYTVSYDALYQFENIERGSTEELCYRLLIRNTFQEGLAIDSLAQNASRHHYLGQQEHANALEFILADELIHANIGLRWTCYICGNAENARKKRVEAIKAFQKVLKNRRLRFVADHPKKVIDELNAFSKLEKQIMNQSKFSSGLHWNKIGRAQAGFEVEDLEQMKELGFVLDP